MMSLHFSPPKSKVKVTAQRPAEQSGYPLNPFLSDSSSRNRGNRVAFYWKKARVIGCAVIRISRYARNSTMTTQK